MVKKKRKNKQKRSTGSHDVVTSAISAEQSPLYIDIASPATGPKTPDRYRSQTRSEVEDLGTASPEHGMVTGSIVGLTSGEIRIDNDAALSIRFEADGPVESKSSKGSIVVNEGAEVEEPERYAFHGTDPDPDGPTPAPGVPDRQDPEEGAGDTEPLGDEDFIEDLGPGLPEETEQPKKRRNTLPQHARQSSELPEVSGEICIVSGEIAVVPEHDIPPKRTTRDLKARAKPASEPVPEIPSIITEPPPAPVAVQPDPPPPAPVSVQPDPPPPAPAAFEETPIDEKILAERREKKQRQSEELRRIIASVPVPFALDIPDKSSAPSDEGFVPAVPMPDAQAGSAVSLSPDPPDEKPPEPKTGTPTTSAKETKQKKVAATPLEDSLVSSKMEKMSSVQHSGRLPRGVSRDDLPSKAFSTMEEEFFDKELHPENDYSGLEEVFAQMQEQNGNGNGLFSSIKRLFVADAPAPKNGNAKKPAAKKPTSKPRKKKPDNAPKKP